MGENLNMLGTLCQRLVNSPPHDATYRRQGTEPMQRWWVRRMRLADRAWAPWRVQHQTLWECMCPLSHHNFRLGLLCMTPQRDPSQWMPTYLHKRVPRLYELSKLSLAGISREIHHPRQDLLTRTLSSSNCTLFWCFVGTNFCSQRSIRYNFKAKR